MCNEQQAAENGLACVAPSAVSHDDWQALEWQLMVLALEAEAAGDLS
ncbi:hypothetical protein Pres01_46540 [Metapseudomonas resinovorans]|nr:MULTISPECIES: hypothetical protein [Pseudomonas]GLZ88603.1 hypothetical protein Pres01_46540 [Pseudomonas resinovorans]